MAMRGEGRRIVTRVPPVLKAHPARLHLLRLWAGIVRERYLAPVYLFGSAARGSLNPRDYDVCVVLTADQFAARYATPSMRRQLTPSEIVRQWDREEWGSATVTSLWDRWVTEVRRTQKEAYRHTELVIDFTVRPLSSWRTYINIQYWQLA